MQLERVIYVVRQGAQQMMPFYLEALQENSQSYFNSENKAE